jgi:cytochrome c oxidase subunit III
MPGASVAEDVDLGVSDHGGSGGGKLPPTGRGGGDEGGDKPHRDATPLSKIYSIALGVGLASILMFFLALASAFIILKVSSPKWVPAHLPPLVWVNTALLLTSSATLELARRRLRAADIPGFRRFWTITTVLGLMFLSGQLVVWQQLNAQGVYVASNQASSFFYIFTGAHGVHLMGGVCALLYVILRKFDRRGAPLSTAAQLAAFYWHFMDGMWVFLLVLLYLGK